MPSAHFPGQKALPITLTDFGENINPTPPVFRIVRVIFPKIQKNFTIKIVAFWPRFIPHCFHFFKKRGSKVASSFFLLKVAVDDVLRAVHLTVISLFGIAGDDQKQIVALLDNFARLRLIVLVGQVLLKVIDNLLFVAF